MRVKFPAACFEREFWIDHVLISLMRMQRKSITITRHDRALIRYTGVRVLLLDKQSARGARAVHDCREHSLLVHDETKSPLFSLQFFSCMWNDVYTWDTCIGSNNIPIVWWTDAIMLPIQTAKIYEASECCVSSQIRSVVSLWQALDCTTYNVGVYRRMWYLPGYHHAVYRGVLLCVRTVWSWASWRPYVHPF